MAYLNYADRLNQLPLSVIGTALGTAILPAISRAIDRDRDDEAARHPGAAPSSSRMLLTLPATARAGGRGRADHRAPCSRAAASPSRMRRSPATSSPSSSSACPAYVLVKVLTPGFYARKDVQHAGADRDRGAGRQRRRQLRS